MARYYFHLRDDVPVDDEEGQVFPDLEAARNCAVKYARELGAAAITENGKLHLHHSIDVADETGRVLTRVRFGDAIAVEDHGSCISPSL